MLAVLVILLVVRPLISKLLEATPNAIAAAAAGMEEGTLITDQSGHVVAVAGSPAGSGGIIDGEFEDEDPVILIPSGIFMPVGYETRVIDMDSLTNYFITCQVADPLCIGGTNALSVDPNNTRVNVLSVEYIQVDAIDNPELVVTVPEFTNNHNSTFNVYIKTSFTGDYELVGSLSPQRQ